VSYKNNERGFSLLEIMVVLIIIGVMASIVAPRFIERADEAKVDSTKVQIKNIEQALKLYRLQHGKYPASTAGLKVLVNKDKGGKKYLDALPKDAWGGDFIYLSPGIHGEVDIMSYGADGKLGGVEFNADIGNWK